MNMVGAVLNRNTPIFEVQNTHPLPRCPRIGLQFPMAQVLWNADIDVYNEKIIPLSVARTISWYLDFVDLSLFSLVSKNAFKAVREPALWVLKLRRMGIWDEGIELPSGGISECDFEPLKNPLLCLSRIYKHPKLARFQMLRIHTCLKSYYEDLQLNLAYNHLKIFKNFHTPKDQAKILSNLLKYNEVDPNEHKRSSNRQKITDLMEIFENALLRELEIHYDIQDYEKMKIFVDILIDLGNDQTLIDFFLQKSCFDNERVKFLNLESRASDLFFTKEQNGEKTNLAINEAAVLNFISELASLFNEMARMIDLVFPQSVQMMHKLCEEIISNQLLEVLVFSIIESKENGSYLKFVPLMYNHLTRTFIDKLNSSSNIGVPYKGLVRQLLDVTFDSYVSEYVHEERTVFKEYCKERIKAWKKSIDAREAETTQSILRHVKVQSKSDFLSNFKKVFTMNGSISTANDATIMSDALNYSQGQADAKILAENIKSLNKIFSPEVAFDILKVAKQSLERLFVFQEFTMTSVLLDIHANIQEEFMDAIECLGADHLRLGFEKSLKYLKEYDPKRYSISEPVSQASAIAPLVVFFELLNVADLIVQMLDMFYKEEMVHKSIIKNENSILNPSLQSKRNLEAMVDKYVADGLNIGIEILFKEIDSVYLSSLRDDDYNPPKGKQNEGPTHAAKRVVLILEENIDLLVGSADKSIIEVFQQEVAERFFQAIVKLLKRSTVSVEGAVVLIFDLNLYYDFILGHILSNKRFVYPLFQALKKVGTIYLIAGEDAKAIGQIVSDLSKFNGIFSQEEIYEFVQRRQDWPLIRKHVEKVMYGLSLTDCTLM